MSSSSRNKAIVRYNTDDTEPGTSNSTADHRSESSGKRRKNQVNNGCDQQLDDEDMERIISDCVKYLLINDHKKTPIKRIDLLKAVLKQTPNRKTVEQLMERLRSHLSDAFAIELAECPETSNSYILVNNLSADVLKDVIDGQFLPDNQLLHSSILVPVLAVIFMSGGTVHEDIIWKFLHKLGFDSNSKSKTIEIENDSNGITVKKLLTELWVRQLYLNYQKIPRTDSNSYEFKWGFRAEKEFSKMDILKFVCEVFGQTEPNYWRTQYAIAQNESNPIENDADVQVIT